MAYTKSFAFFLCCSLLFSFWSRVHGNEAFAKASLKSLTPSSTCSVSDGNLPRAFPTIAAGSRSSLAIVNRNGACSGELLRNHNPIVALTHDALRVASFHESILPPPTETDTPILESQISIPAKSGVYIGTGDYVITVGFGTPVTAQTVIFDTGSDVSWIQCKPCSASCYSQQDPLFDPTLSSTYRNISCTATACEDLRIRGCSAGTCLYAVSYGDGSLTVGFLAMDTFTLASGHTFDSFIFGCGQKNQGLFKGTAGLIGLGRNSFSLNSQVGPTLGNVFSYCLPSSKSATGYLNIGNPMKTPDYTAMLTDPRAPSLYFIDLIGITVGDTKLAVSPTVFQSAGTIIDSGTVITRLPPAAYSALRTAFKSAMTQYTPVPGASILDTCYDFSNVTTVTYPVIKLQFTGLDVTLPGTGVFYFIRPSQVCLAFAGNSDANQIGIIGNVQQQTAEVTYDNQQKRIGFSAGACD